MQKVTPEEWEKALVSGDYLRATEQLRFDSEWDDPRYCCLGVLAELCGINIDGLKNGAQSEMIPFVMAATWVPWLSNNDQSALAGLNDDNHEGDDWSKTKPDSQSVLDYIDTKWLKEPVLP